LQITFLKDERTTSLLLNVYRDSDVRQIEIYTAEPLVPDSSPFKVDIAIVKLKSYKSSGSDQIAAELIQAVGETLWSKIHKLTSAIHRLQKSLRCS
jgi:hypothetical protein